jgi:hypothetical protein
MGLIGNVEQHQPITDDQSFSTSVLTLPLSPPLTTAVHTFFRSFRTATPWSDSLVSCTLDRPPQTKDDSVQKHCSIVSDLSHLKKSQFKRRWRHWRPYYTANYQLVMNLRGGNLGFELVYGGMKYGVAQMEFDG